eukprot:5843383-Ditylum_brightwellii.AAC.2
MFRRKRGSDELCNPGEEVVQLLDGRIVGQRCAPFDYTGCNSSRGRRLGSQQPPRWCSLGYRQC